jgi:hypothetical protein
MPRVKYLAGSSNLYQCSDSLPVCNVVPQRQSHKYAHTVLLCPAALSATAKAFLAVESWQSRHHALHSTTIVERHISFINVTIVGKTAQVRTQWTSHVR